MRHVRGKLRLPHELLADSLEELQSNLEDGIYRSGRIPQRHFARLHKSGYLVEIIKGWYHVANPAAPSGVTLWHGHFWPFVRQYLRERFGLGYCLSAETSLLLHAGLTRVPKQILVLTDRPSGNRIGLPHDHSLLTYQERGGLPEDIEWVDGIRVMTTANALSRASEGFYREFPLEAAALLSSIGDLSPLLRPLLERGATVFAGRAAGAMRHIGRHEQADRVVSAMRAANYEVAETNPFDIPVPALGGSRAKSPYVSRIRLMWANMRDAVIEAFPEEPGLPSDSAPYLASMRAIQTLDAYHSLSIEGYKVDAALIERVRSNAFDPAKVAEDQDRSSALAARGYYDAYRLVVGSVEQILAGANSTQIVETSHHEWHRALFQVAVQAGLFSPTELAGYRSHQVYINGANHVPLPPNAVLDAMEALFDLIAHEPHAAVRAVLGHFVFVFIHPYADGNGRLGRFLMNAMLASGGYPWTIIHLDARSDYLAALEAASSGGDIHPFAEFLAGQMRRTTNIPASSPQGE